MAKTLSHEEFEYIYTRAPRLCVDLIVKNDQGILLTLRNIPPAKGYWHLPGGTVLHGETLEEAAQRVAKQELGVAIKIIKQLGLIEYFGKSANYGHVLSVAFLVKLKSNKIKLDHQATEFKFFKNIPEKTIKETKLFLLNR